MELELELGLGLALPNPHSPASAGLVGLLDGAPAGACGKRAFSEAFAGADKATATLPLFVLDGDGDGGGGGGDGADRETSNKRKRLVGWPPVKCGHRRSFGGGGGGGAYVKVKMEGVAIGRKVDVSLHGSYEELLRTLARMFPSTNQAADAEEAGDGEVAEHEHGRHRHHVVTYEDGDGDWLLVGDVPWEAFANSVKRLKILA